MQYFEHLGEDGRIYLHYDRWTQWRNDRLREYPCPPGKFRYDLELAHPRRFLHEVPVINHPHHPPNACYYECDDWSTIFGVYHAYPHPTPSYRMIVESGNDDPIWGEPVALFCTSCSIEDEPWGRNPSNRFAFFRGMFWQVRWREFLNVWQPPITYPISNFNRANGNQPILRRPRPYAHDPTYMRVPFVNVENVWIRLQEHIRLLPTAIWEGDWFVPVAIWDSFGEEQIKQVDWLREGF